MSAPLRTALAAAPLLALAACSAAPRIETTLAGTIPAGKSYAMVDGAKYFGSADLPVTRVEQCLGSAGLTRGSTPEVLVQVAHMVRPARTRVLDPAATDAARRSTRSARDRDELVLALTDPASGALLLRASAARILGAGEVAGNGADLAETLCGVVTPAGRPVAATAR